MLVLLLACADDPTCTPAIPVGAEDAVLSGEVPWMGADHTGYVHVGVVGEAPLGGEVWEGDALVCELYAAPRRLGPDGVYLVIEWCGEFE